MRVSELKYFETESFLTNVKNQSKSLNPFSLTADVLLQNKIFGLQQLRTPKVDLSRLLNEYTNLYLTYIPDKRNACIGNVVVHKRD